MKFKRNLFLQAILLIVCGIVSGCSSNKSTAKLYSNSKEWVLPSFLENNKVGGAFYKNPNYVEGQDELDEEYYYDEESPASRTFIITDREKYNTVFVEDSLKVDFEKEMVILYIFPDVYSREYQLEELSVNDQIVTVKYKLESSDKKDATAPYQRCMVLKMEKSDVLSAEFIEIR